MTQKKDWFIEKFESCGTCFGLQVEAHLHTEQSDYQRIDVYETTSFGRLLTLDGCIMLTQRDNFIYHEMMSHPALLAHPSPKRVAIIGGGDCGTLLEVLKHKVVEQAVQIELDERVTRVTERFFPELVVGQKDPRAELLFTDGFEWIKQQASNAFDVIIVDSTDPVGPAAVLFSEAFLKACCRVLTQRGILVQQTESPLLHGESLIAPLHRQLKQLGFATVETLHYPQPVYPSGWWSCTLSSPSLDLRQCRQDDTLNTKYYSGKMGAASKALPPFLESLILM